MPNNCLLDDRKKICLPGQAANDLAKTRAYPTLAPLLLLKQVFDPSYFSTALTLTTLMPCPSARPKGFWTCTKKFGLNQKF